MTSDQMGAGVLVLDGPAMLAHGRSFVAEQLEELGLSEVLADAQVVVSELTTNVFLHTEGPAQLAVVAVGDGVRIEVSDTSSAPPVRTGATSGAMTGRGLQLVEALSTRWGVTPLPRGKVVWAELRPAAEGGEAGVPALDEDALLAMWDDEEFDSAEIRRAPIDLGAVPTGLLIDAKAHVDGLVREFTLMASGSRSGAGAEVPEAVRPLIDVVLDGFAEPRATLKRLALGARARGEDQVDVVLPVPEDIPGTIAAGEAYLEALDQANAFCRAVQLLTLESPPRHRIFHQWYVTEYIASLRAVQQSTAYQPTPFTERLLAEVDDTATTRGMAD